ncbi:MAG TPA: hypothetical protein DEP05_00470 [Betaproteobacteria bacterium]|nr:hypothetical protein [Betaproteobacteria bacterium]
MADETKPTMHQLVRRRLLKSAVTSLGAALIGYSSRVYAGSKFPKKTMDYRDRPNGQKMCANCSHFLPDKNPRNTGRCTVVEGNIGPHGWCMVWATRKPIEGC